jgi:glycosyltransferase involved in cell wall biosynthesis
LIIVNDNPLNKEFKNLLDSFKDPRLIYVANKINIGLTKSLNNSIDIAQGDFIARMDADDISVKERIEKQVDFFNKNREYFVLGTWVEVIDENNFKIGIRQDDYDDNLIKIKTLFQVPFIHPTVMFRSEIFKKYGYRYNNNFKYAQDFELWSRLVHNFKISNLPEYLLKYRKSSNQISQKNKLQQTEYFLDAIQNQLQSFNINVSNERRQLIKLITRNHDNFPIIFKDLKLLKELIKDLIIYNKKENHFDSDKLKSFLRQKYLDCFQAYQGSFYDYVKVYYHIEFYLLKSVSILGFLKLVKRGLLNLKRESEINS